MDTTEFLATVLPSQGFKCLAIMTDQGMRHRWFQDFPSMAASISALTQAGFEVFYGLSGYALGSDGKVRRRAANATHSKSFWFDLDVGENKPYACVEDALHSVKDVCSTNQIPYPMLVSSGYGIHGYWTLPRDITAAQWQPVASTLKQLLPALGLQIGVERTADIASILRPVGAINHKRGGSAPVQLLRPIKDVKETAKRFLQQVQFLSQARNILPDIASKHAAPTNSLAAALGNIYQDRPLSAQALYERCPWMQYAKDHAAQLSEPAWYAVLNVLKLAEGADEAAQAWSQGHPGYSPERTTAKLEHAQNSGTGPTTCAKFSGLNDSPCAGCSHRGQITSPAQLGREAPPPAQGELETHPGVDVVQPAPGWRIDQYGGIWKEEKDSQPVLIYPYPIFIKSRARDGSGSYTYSLHIGREDGGFTRLDVGGELFARPTDLHALMCQKGVSSLSPGDLVNFLKSFAEDIKTRMSAAQMYPRMGWQPIEVGNKTIEVLVGPRGRYFGDEPPGGVLFTASAQTVVNPIIPQRGTLQDWIAAVAPLGRSPAHAFGLLMGFAAPLVKLSGYHGFLVNLYGTTGVGKSAVQEAVASIYGPWAGMRLRASDTLNALMTSAGTLSALPVLIEEITAMKSEAVMELAYAVTEGRGKRRARKDGALQETVHEWDTVFLTSTNKSIADTLPSAQFTTQEAVLARVMEVEVTLDRSKVNGLTNQHLRECHFGTTHNYGVVGDDWLAYVALNAGVLADEIQEAQQALRPFVGGDESAARFWLAASALVAVAFKHVRARGWFDVPDLAEFQEFLKAQIQGMQQLRQEAVHSLQERFQYFLSEHHKYTILAKESPNSVLKWEVSGPALLAANPVYVRQEMNPRGVPTSLMIVGSRLRDWCATKGYSYGELVRWMREVGLIKQSGASVRMARGMSQEAAQQRSQAFILDANHQLLRTVRLVQTEPDPAPEAVAHAG